MCFCFCAVLCMQCCIISCDAMLCHIVSCHAMLRYAAVTIFLFICVHLQMFLCVRVRKLSGAHLPVIAHVCVSMCLVYAIKEIESHHLSAKHAFISYTNQSIKYTAFASNILFIRTHPSQHY